MAKKRYGDVDRNPKLNKIVENRYAKLDKKIQKNQGNDKKLSKINKKFGYNYDAAIKSGASPDKTGHWPSIGDDGLVLKGKRHPSMIKTKIVEKQLGYKIKNKKGA